MVKKEDKAKPKNWVDGDTFIWKIESEKYPEYNGKYLIYIYTNDSEWQAKKYISASFRIKITKDSNVPKSKEELDQLEYIQIICGIYDEIQYQYPEKTKKIKRDEYGLVYQYIYELMITKNSDLTKLIYLDNYQVTKPLNEYIPKTQFCGVKSGFIEDSENSILQSYINYNLKKSWVFDEDSVKEREENFRNWVKEQEFYQKLGDALEGPNGKEILHKMGIDIENEVPHESETYVGGEENFKE